MTDAEAVLTIALGMFFTFVFIGYYVVCIFVSVKIMEAKGRPRIIGGLMAVFFGIVGVVLCYCLPEKEGQDGK